MKDLRILMVLAALALCLCFLPGCEEKEASVAAPEPVYEYDEDSSPGRQMLQAAEYGDVQHIQKLYEEGTPLTVREGIGDNTPIVVAAKSRQLEVLRYLLDKGVNPDEVDGWNSTALKEAVWEGWFEGMALLLERGASANGPNVENAPPVTPYFTALYLGKLGMAQYLLDHGADGSYVGAGGYTALHCALDLYPPSRRFQYSPLEDKSNLDAVTFAVENGANLNAVYHGVGRKYDITPLAMAAIYQNRAAYDYLVAQGANSSRKDDDGNTPEAYFGFAKIYAGYAVFGDYYKNDALFRAITPDVPLSVIEHLVEDARADVNEHYHGEYTPLIVAAVMQRKDIYEYLLECGADPGYQDEYGNRAADYLAGKRHPGSAFVHYYAKLDEVEGAPKTMRTEKPQDYFVVVNYRNDDSVRLFINGKPVNEPKGGGSGFAIVSCKEYFKDGENTIRVSWGPLPGDDNWNEQRARYYDDPDLYLMLDARYDKHGQDTESLLVKKPGMAEALVLDGVRVPAYEFVFDAATGKIR